MLNITSLFKNELKLNIKTPLIVSVSGGMDSMALLHLLKDSSFKIVVVHFNHLKRDESVIEKDLVESYCKEHKIPFHYYTVNVDEGNFHNQAHHLRNHYLIEVSKMYKSPYILTAHHQDDLLENILIKLTRGSNLLGYAGMQMVYKTSKEIFIKPLLYNSRSEIEAYVKENKIPYLDDSSNEENYYLRNRYRHAVIPIMKQENEQLLDQVKQFHHQISKAFHFIRNQTKKLINENHIPLDVFLEQDEAIQDDMIAFLLEKYKIVFTYETIRKINKMLSSTKPNQTYKLSNDCHLIKSYNLVYVESIATKKQDHYILKDGANRIENMAIFTLLNNSNTNTENFNKLCYNKLAFPLILRHRLDGDNLSFTYGHKKLKKLLIDLKVPMKKRDGLWVLVDKNKTILWVQDYYTNQTLGNAKELYINYEEVK
jgi:tRNA(Ile)-lysidine synthetase-like protein